MTVSTSVFGEIKRLFTQSAVYGIAGASSTAVGMLLVPLYAHLFTPEEFGQLQLAQLWLSIASTVAGLGLTQAYFKAYHQYPSAEERGQTLGMVLSLSILSAGLACLLFIVLSKQTFTDHFVLLRDPWILGLILTSLVTSVVIRILFQVLRAREQSFLYLKLGVIGLLAGLLFNVLFVWGFAGRVEGVLAAQSLSALIIIALAISIFVPHIGLSTSRVRVKELFVFGLPFVPAAMALWVLDGSDRVIIERFWGVSEVGIYSLGYKYSTLLLFPLLAFQAAWAPYLCSVAKQEGALQMISRILTFISASIMIFATFLYVMSREILSLIASPEFSGAHIMVAPLLLGFVFYGLYFITISGVYVHGKTGFVAIITGIAATLNLLLNFIMIPRLGGMGAAWATAISYMVLAGLIYRFNRKHLPILLEWRPLIFATACCLVVAVLNDHLILDGWTGLLVRVVMVGLIPAVLWFSGFFTHFERKQIHAYAKTLKWVGGVR